MIFNIKEENWRKIGVYCITNLVNNKIYIGSTTTNFRHRYLQYKSGFLRKLDNQPVLYKAFRKYGFENFSFNIVCITSKEEAIVMEQFYIDKGVDYNSCLIAGSLQGLKHSLDSKTRTVTGAFHHSAKKIYQFDLNGNFVKEWGSVIDALKSLNKTKTGSSHITQCCIGNTVSAFGYKWSFTKTLINRIDKRSLPITEQKRSNMSKPRKKEGFKVKGLLSTNLNTGKNSKFDTIKQASEELLISENSIRNNLTKRSKAIKSKLNNNKYIFKWDIDTT